MNFRAYFIPLFFILSGCSEETEASCTGYPAEHYFSTYDVTDVERYRGGLTTENAAKDRLGKNVIVLQSGFSSDLAKILKPRYEIRCYPVEADKGNVPSKRWSNFYGLGEERTSIDILEVYAPGDENEEPSYYFEVVDETLWELFDGWKYELQRSK